MTSGTYSLRDRILGAYLGAAAGDALGGPIESWHAEMIKAAYRGYVTRFLPFVYRAYPDYARPGSITDDTFIKDAFSSFVLAHRNEAERTPESLARYLLAHANFFYWNPPDVTPLRKIESGEMTPEETGEWYRIGGGAAWWTPFGLIHAGKPDKAYEETYRLSIVWKKPFERNLIAAVQAAVAVAVLPGSTVDTVVDTVLQYAGPLARKLLLRAQRIANEHEGDLDGLIKGIYAEALVDEGTGDIDGPMPPSHHPPSPYRGATVLWAEQIPLAFAALIFGKGNFVDTLVACVNMGRDADSTATTVGSWIGGLLGLQGMPQDWVETLQSVNLERMDILAQANGLADLAGA